MHLEYCEVKRLYHTHYIHRVSFQHVLVHVFKDDCDKQSLSTLITVIMFLSSMGFFYVFRDYRDKQRLYHTDYIKRVSLQYVFFFMSLEITVTYKGFTTLITFIGYLSIMGSLMTF